MSCLMTIQLRSDEWMKPVNVFCRGRVWADLGGRGQAGAVTCMARAPGPRDDGRAWHGVARRGGLGLVGWGPHRTAQLAGSTGLWTAARRPGEA